MGLRKKGFTLLELLIAAAIVSVLAVFATRSYQNSAAETHLRDGIARARAVAAAIQRFNIDYPGSSFASADLIALDSVGACTISASVSPSQLINCGYLDNRPWSDAYVTIQVCGTSASASSMCKNASPLANPLVCVSLDKGNKKIPNHLTYNPITKKNHFCISARGERGY